MKGMSTRYRIEEIAAERLVEYASIQSMLEEKEI
jgi:hypothetical protein